MQVCGRGGVYLEVTLTFWRGAHDRRLVSMATVSSDEGPAPAVAQPVFISAATQALVVEESGAGAEGGVFERRADVAVGTKEGGVCRSRSRNRRGGASLPHLRPSCLQTTLASLSDQWESHTAPHWLLR